MAMVLNFNVCTRSANVAMVLNFYVCTRSANVVMVLTYDSAEL